MAAYRKLYEQELIPSIEKGLSAIVYTQLSDVEGETNGLLTYDREVIKLPVEEIARINRRAAQRDRRRSSRRKGCHKRNRRSAAESGGGSGRERKLTFACCKPGRFRYSCGEIIDAVQCLLEGIGVMAYLHQQALI